MSAGELAYRPEGGRLWHQPQTCQAGHGGSSASPDRPPAHRRPETVRSESRFIPVDLRVARHGEQRRRTRGTSDRQIGRQAEMTQDPADDGGRLDERDEAQAAATARTRQHIELEGTPQQIRPDRAAAGFRRDGI